MEIKHILPSDIEKTSLGIIKQELTQMGKTLPDDTEATVIRVIHTTADFEYADTMMFSEGAVEKGLEAIKNGAHIVTDTNMAYEADGSMQPEFYVEFTENEIKYGHLKDEEFVVDHVDKIESMLFGEKCVIQATASTGVKYTYQTSESDSNILEYYETWNEEEYPDALSVPITVASLCIVLLIVTPNTKATMMIIMYKRTSIIALSPTISSPVNVID